MQSITNTQCAELCLHLHSTPCFRAPMHADKQPELNYLNTTSPVLLVTNGNCNSDLHWMKLIELCTQLPCRAYTKTAYKFTSTVYYWQSTKTFSLAPVRSTRCSAVAERPRCRVRYSFCHK